MSLTHLFVFLLIALIAGWLIPGRWRISFLLGASLIFIYWLQPSTPIRNLDFWLPTASIFLTVLVWAITHQPQANSMRLTWITASIVVGVVILVGVTRYVEPICCLTPSRPPELFRILITTGLAAGIIALLYHFSPGNRFLPYLAIFTILGLFIILKSEPLSRSTSAWLRYSTGQPYGMASALDLPWLGFSYLSFRLLHVLRDYQSGKLPPFSLDEFITYALFFPSYTAGPIDRSERFVGDLRKSLQPLESPTRYQNKVTNTAQGVQRIVLGIFKKFVIADSLAIFALNPQNAVQTTSTLWMWVLLLAFSLRIYFDFSGYTDIAVGLGRLVGIKLPENFDRPYLKTNLAMFWNSWHITLAQFFRAYYFNPLTRMLRTSKHPLPAWTIILIGQLTTMLLIGLWHGISWNFFIWGAWHGLGLFIHNRWTEWIRPREEFHTTLANNHRLTNLLNWMVTFIFVTVGWVWFALPNPALAWKTIRILGGE